MERSPICLLSFNPKKTFGFLCVSPPQRLSVKKALKVFLVSLGPWWQILLFL